MICTTLLVLERKPLLLSLHLFRLQQQAEFLKIPLPIDVQNLILEHIQEMTDAQCALRIIIDINGNTSISTRRIPQRLGMVAWSEKSHSRQHSWIKYSDRSGWNSEKKKRNAQHLLFYQNDELLEFSEGNLFVFYNGGLFTPPSDGRVLPGIARESILFISRYLGLAVNEQKCLLKWKQEGASLYFSSSLRGLQPLAGEDITLSSEIQKYFWNVEWIEKQEEEICRSFKASFSRILSKN